ncbi:MAG: hypothetical protein IJB88_00095, partial [Clostridia bacterium]|nr:hypothetical protein [Clostridia bacterium]
LREDHLRRHLHAVIPHCTQQSKKESLCRPCVRALYDAGVFGLLVLLSPGYGVQIVEETPCV